MVRTCVMTRVRTVVCDCMRLHAIACDRMSVAATPVSQRCGKSFIVRIVP